MNSSTLGLLSRFAQLARVPRVRGIGEFAESEIVIPTGPHAGRRFSAARNPFARSWFEEIDSGRWRRHVATGPQQSGKTLQCFVIPTLYHLFELNETVLCGLPSLDMVADKWGEDLLPAIAASRYRELLPKRGPGSKGGDTPAIQFANGATLKFMSGGGGDKSRAGFTSRVLVVTETDGMDEAGGASREADKITQLEGRTTAFGDRARIYLECTVSTEAGRTWKEYQAGTQSRLAIRCPHCQGWVTPEREHLYGWQGAEDEIAAGERARFACPACGCEWTNADRVAANQHLRLVHRGQSIDDAGEVHGAAGGPRTNTLGFRWTAVNNLLVHQSVIAQREWRAAREQDERKQALAEREMCQFVWACPPKPAALDSRLLDAAIICARVRSEGRGRVPADAEKITLGVDIGKWLCHWVAIAWRKQGAGCSPHVLAYGLLDVHSESLTVEHAVLQALREFRDGPLSQGWPTKDGSPRVACYRIFDSGDWTATVKLFCAESGAGHLASKGMSSAQAGGRRTYHEQKSTGATVALIGEQYHVAKQADGHLLLEPNVDYWKTWLHDRLKTPLEAPGAMTLFNDSAQAHTKFSRHLLAEKQGDDGRWHVESRNNHYFDAAVLACIGGHLAGERLIAPPADTKQPNAPATLDRPGLRMPDGRPYLVTQR